MKVYIKSGLRQSLTYILSHDKQEYYCIDSKIYNAVMNSCKLGCFERRKLLPEIRSQIILFYVQCLHSAPKVS